MARGRAYASLTPEELAEAKRTRESERLEIVRRVAKVSTLIAAGVPPSEIVAWLMSEHPNEGKHWTVSKRTAQRYIQLAYRGWDREDADDDADMTKARARNRRTAQLIIRNALQAGKYNAAVAALKLLAEMEGSIDPAPIQVNVGISDPVAAAQMIDHAAKTLELARRRGVLAPSVIDATATEHPAPTRRAPELVEADEIDESDPLAVASRPGGN